MAGIRLWRTDARALAAWAAAAAALSVGGGLLVGTAPLVALDAALLALAAVLIARYPYHSLVLIVVVRGTAPNTPLLDGITLVAGGAAVLVAAPKLPGRRVILPLLAFLAVAILSTPLAPTAIEGVKDDWLRVPHFGWPYARNPSVPLYEWMRLASMLAVFCLAAWVINSRRRLDVFVAAVLASAVVPIVIGLKQFATGETVARSGSGEKFRAVIGTFSTPGPFAFYMVVVLVLAIVVFLEARAIATRVAVGVLMAGAGACLLLTYARSAWIAFAVAVIVLALLRYRRLLLIGMVGLVLALVGLPSLVNKVEARFGDLTSRSQAESGNSWSWRTGNWSAILPYGYARPLTGQGFGSYPALTVKHWGTQNRDYPTIADRQHPATSSRGLLAHNDYVRTFVELGVPGFLLWAAVLLGLLTGSARAVRRPGVGPVATAGVGVALALIVIAFSDNLLSAPVMLYAFALGGAVMGADARLPGRRRPVAAEVAPAPAVAPLTIAGETIEEEPEPTRVAVAPPRPSQARTSVQSAQARLRGLFRRRR